jgi:hypothetical protein
MPPFARCSVRSPGPIAVVLAATALIGGRTPAWAQYPLVPAPVLPLPAFTRQPAFTGYLSMRETLRDGALTFVVNRARVAAQALAAPYAALRVQADLAAIGRTSGDTVPAIALTDAYVAFFLPDSTSRVARLLRPEVAVGQFRTPFSLEYLTSFVLLPLPNRSQAVDRLSPRRDLGLLGQAGYGSVVTLAAAVVNGEGPNHPSNPDGREMVVGRLTLSPVANFALSGKWLREGGDHRWGYDARWIGTRLIVEGEAIREKEIAAGSTISEAAGGYLLGAYRPRSWIQLAAKWERLHETPGGGKPEHRLTWATVGVNFLGPQDRLRLQVAWIGRHEEPVRASGEVLAQVKASF